jgi:DNA-binding CsgD family transcriptional regulator
MMTDTCHLLRLVVPRSACSTSGGEAASGGDTSTNTDFRRREPLGAARDLAHQSGADAIEQRAHEELMVAGARPRRVAPSGLDSLTAAERRVAELAAAGMRKRDIAESLFVTAKTVEVHLGRIYGKLDIRGRSQLPELLRPERWLGEQADLRMGRMALDPELPAIDDRVEPHHELSVISAEAAAGDDRQRPPLHGQPPVELEELAVSEIELDSNLSSGWLLASSNEAASTPRSSGSQRSDAARAVPDNFAAPSGATTSSSSTSSNQARSGPAGKAAMVNPTSERVPSRTQCPVGSRRDRMERMAPLWRSSIRCASGTHPNLFPDVRPGLRTGRRSRWLRRRWCWGQRTRVAATSPRRMSGLAFWVSGA